MSEHHFLGIGAGNVPIRVGPRRLRAPYGARPRWARAPSEEPRGPAPPERSGRVRLAPPPKRDLALHTPCGGFGSPTRLRRKGAEEEPKRSRRVRHVPEHSLTQQNPPYGAQYDGRK